MDETVIRSTDTTEVYIALRGERRNDSPTDPFYEGPDQLPISEVVGVTDAADVASVQLKIDLGINAALGFPRTIFAALLLISSPCCCKTTRPRRFSCEGESGIGARAR